jgi:predicted methyltransferase MtxX (methanogen marker protein 4)
VTFFRGVDAIATQVISGARNDVTGNITLTATTHTGEAVTVTFANNGTQVASATIVHDESMAQTSVLFQSIKDGTALGGFSGGGGK